MSRANNQIRLFCLGFLMIECCILFVVYNFISTPLFFWLGIYSLVKNIILMIIVLFVTYYLDNHALSVKEALNEDSANIFMFGGIGVLEYDANRNIKWTSDLFKELNINISGVKLLEWKPQLNSLFEDEDIKVIDIKGKKFETYINEETKLIYFKDVTNYTSLKQDYLDQQLVMAYITIDNYEETLDSLDVLKASMIQSKASQLMSEWANENGVILKKFKNNGYIALFNEMVYRKQVENKFSLLDSFKEMSEEEGEYMTLSIGIGRDSKILKELDDRAMKALSLSYSRGGDQVAVKSSDDNVRYFGGTSDTHEKSNKVKSRIVAQSLAALIKKADHVLIMGHNKSDLDSVGASLGVYKLVCAYGKKANVIIDYESLEDKTKGVVEQLRNNHPELFLTFSESLETITKDSLLICVDHHKDGLAIAPSLIDRISNKVVIDHHRRGEEFIQAPTLSYLEPSASSTVELIVELYQYLNVDIDITSEDATIMYAGMVVDTNNFKQRVGVRTFESAAKLRDMQANVQEAMSYLEDSFEQVVEQNTIANRAYRFKKNIMIAVAPSEEEYSRTVFAKVANSLVEVSGVKAAFVAGKENKSKVCVSARSGKDFNVQVIMERIGGGGHFSIAAAQIENKSLEQVVEMLENEILNYLEDRGV